MGIYAYIQLYWYDNKHFWIELNWIEKAMDL